LAFLEQLNVTVTMLGEAASGRYRPDAAEIDRVVEHAMRASGR
jgi:hypothetical protein